MAKLKYDRPINISMRQYQTVTIPKDEVWKVSTDTEGSSAPTKLFGGGSSFRSGNSSISGSYGVPEVSGIAFKHIDE